MEKPILVVMAAGMGSRYGVTYAADKPVVVAALREMTGAGIYPDGLWRE